MTPEAYCYAKRAKGTQCDASDPGSCRECEMVAELGNHFGDGVSIDGETIAKILTPPTRACNVCQREAIAGLAFKGNPLCAACAPYPNAGEIMLEFSDAEEEAIEAGGAAAGAYLDGIGKTDLAALSENEWHEFLCAVLAGYSEHMRALVKEAPPF